MILTLAWKELREHQGVWLTMAIMTIVLGFGLPRIVALEDPRLAVPVAALTILGMAATYGVVCGAMMLAGEHEGGTLVFLDIFLGRRGILWMGKFAVGIVLVMAQALAVALALRLMNQEPPGWTMALLGLRELRPDPNVWFAFLPVVSLQAYAWGMLGSSLTQRVLAGAAVAAVGVTPIWLLAVCAPPHVFFAVQLVAAFFVLAISLAVFLGQTRELLTGPIPMAEAALDPKEQFLERWQEFEQEDRLGEEQAAHELPPVVSVAHPVAADERIDIHTRTNPAEPREPKAEHARSPSEVLWWLTLQQAWPLLFILAGACFLIGLLTPANTQVLWPLATLALGVACGTAAFAPEQRDLSYQFLSAQHFPLKMIWRFKILFWLAVAVVGALVIVFGHYLNLALRPAALGPNDGFYGSMPRLMGPTLFFGVWLVYGFSCAQLFVWLCRKSILALLVSFLVAGGAIGLWMPSLLCGGMSGWQVWAPALTLLLATWCLMRAWSSGRIQERKPMAALIGFGSVGVVWALLNFGVRAWQVPDIGPPLDPAEFRASLAADKDNAAAKAIHQAIAQFDQRNDAWLDSMAEAARLPVGVLDLPQADGHVPLLRHLPDCRKMTATLLETAQAKEPASGFEHLAQILALSRNLRNKAPLESYLAGIKAEDEALNGLDQGLARGKPAPERLRRVLAELNRHASETPPPLGCLHTECFRSGGALVNPNLWTFAAPGAAGRMPEQWLIGGIALSMETPWEAERNRRIWQLVWAGLFRAVETPHWELPVLTALPQTNKDATQKIIESWLPAAMGSSAGMTRTDVSRLVDASWLADERLFCSVLPLRNAATRAQWRVDATRQAIALALHQLELGKPAQNLQDLVPNYFPAGLPMDPYSGLVFRYRIAPDNEPAIADGPAPGQGIVWSTGPDRIDHGGRKHGRLLPDDDARWLNGDFDLIKLVPRWP